MDSKILAAVIEDMRRREAKGKEEYKTTLDRTDLKEDEWMQYAYEEALDLSLYLKKIMIINAVKKDI
ncbi:hypothetical protein UFOVP614_20 [uncultured Caudovirales phage]|jgi:hypothetical protein|uniref:Uncharacterized protein n=1 Tax=uncultured Caudovirales phage TaxID=2100421 RepID=A0A6J5N2J4_9CAUD|nr:hypothetical protein UFOVP614_20 [uncultured Caudovirales phage]